MGRFPLDPAGHRCDSHCARSSRKHDNSRGESPGRPREQLAGDRLGDSGRDPLHVDRRRARPRRRLVALVALKRERRRLLEQQAREALGDDFVPLEAGVAAADIMACTGHSSLEEIELYGRKFARPKRAAVAMLALAGGGR
jgi:hypothetical protein